MLKQLFRRRSYMPVSITMRTGITVRDLKRAIKHWPETSDNGEPTEVWLGTGVMLSSPCVEIVQLNRRVAQDGQVAADILLEPDPTVWKPSTPYYNGDAEHRPEEET